MNIYWHKVVERNCQVADAELTDAEEAKAEQHYFAFIVPYILETLYKHCGTNNLPALFASRKNKVS